MNSRLLTLLGQQTLNKGEASELCDKLGNLANWWLPESTLQTGVERGWQRAEVAMPTAPGSCWIVMARKARSPQLRPAFLLPLVWLPGQGHSAGLPAALHKLADDVLKEVGGTDAWSLHPSPVLGPVALGDDLGLTFGSGWASLAGGLQLARDGLPPRSNVWASAAWEAGSGPAGVGFLKQKMDLAREWRQRMGWDTVQFFISLRQQNPIDSGDGAVREWLGYPQRDEKQKVARTLAPYLAACAGQPTPPDPEGRDDDAFKKCGFWYALQTDRPAAQRYYRETLLGPLVARIQRKMPKPDAKCRQPRLCIAIISFNHEQALLTPRVLGVEQCLFLHTSDDKMTKLARRVVTDSTIPAVPLPFSEGDDPDGLVAAFHRLLDPYLGQYAPEDVVFDLTPGDTLMKFALRRIVQPSNRMVCLKADKQEDGGRVIPGGERLVPLNF